MLHKTKGCIVFANAPHPLYEVVDPAPSPKRRRGGKSGDSTKSLSPWERDLGWGHWHYKKTHALRNINFWLSCEIASSQKMILLMNHTSLRGKRNHRKKREHIAAEPPACQSEAAGRQPKKKWTTDFTDFHWLFFYEFNSNAIPPNDLESSSVWICAIRGFVFPLWLGKSCSENKILQPCYTIAFATNLCGLEFVFETKIEYATINHRQSNR